MLTRRRRNAIVVKPDKYVLHGITLTTSRKGCIVEGLKILRHNTFPQWGRKLDRQPSGNLVDMFRSDILLHE